MAAGTRIDDGRKVAGKIVGVTASEKRKGKGDLQRDLGRPDEFSVFPGLTVNRDFAAGWNCIQERLAIASNLIPKVSTPGSNELHFLSEIDTSEIPVSPPVSPSSKYWPPGSATHVTAVVHELLRIRTVHAPSPNGPASRLPSPSYSRKYISGQGSVPNSESSPRPGKLVHAAAIGPGDEYPVRFLLHEKKMKTVRRPVPVSRDFDEAIFTLLLPSNSPPTVRLVA